MALPKGYLGTAVNGENVFAPLVTAAVAVPAYASPMAAMGTVGSMFQHGNSVGAAFAMLALGAGTTLGLLAWAGRAYGPTRTAAMLAAVAGVTLVFSYGVDRPLRPEGAEEGGHTHAFDRYTAPFTPARSAPWVKAWEELADGVGVHERIALIALAVFAALGLGLRLADGAGRTEAWLERPPTAEETAGRFDVTLPAPVLGGAALVGLAAVSVLGCFTYYPPPGECLDQLFVMQGEAMSAANAGDRAAAEEFLPVCEDWAKRAQVGYVLRHGPAGEFRDLRTAIYLDRLEELEHEVARQAAESRLDDPDGRAVRRALVGRIGRGFTRLRQGLRPPSEPLPVRLVDHPPAARRSGGPSTASALPLPCRAYIVPEAAGGGGARPRMRPPVPKADRPDAPAAPSHGVSNVVPTEDELRDRLRETGLRVTPARLAVMKELAGAGVPLSHGEVVDRLRPNRSGKLSATAPAPRRFDQSTLFRGLTDLSDAGLLARLDLGDAVRRYEWLPADGGDPVHPHHVCTDCGRIVCLEGFALKLTPSTGAAREQVGTIGEVVLRGRCGACEERGADAAGGLA